MAEENQIDIEHLSIVELANLSQHVNSGNFSATQKQKVEALVWKKIKDVANRASKLDPQNKDELKAFQSLLDNLPLAYRMETGGFLPTVKSAETRLYNAQNGIDDRTAAEKAKDNINQFGSDVHKAYSDFYDKVDDKVNAWVNTAGEKIESFEKSIKNAPKKLKHNAKLGWRFMRIAANRQKNNTKNWMKNKHQSYSAWYDRMDDKLNAWVDKAGQKIEAFERGLANAPKKLKHNAKLGWRFMRIAANRQKNNTKNWIKNKHQSYSAWHDRIDDKLNAWVDKAGQKIEAFERGLANAPKKLKHNAKLGWRFMRIAANRQKNNAKNWIKNKHQSYSAWHDRIDDKLNAWVDKAGQKIEAFERGLANAPKNIAKFGKNSWNALQRGWQRAKSIINGIKLPQVKGKAGEKSTVLDLANGDLSKLKPEQIKNVYNELKQYRNRPRGDKFGDAYYKISGYSTEILNEIKAKGANSITDENAEKVAAWLEVNKNIQEEVNKNRAYENEARNKEIEGFLNSRQGKTQEKETQGRETEVKIQDKEEQNKDNQEKTEQKQEEKNKEQNEQKQTMGFAAEYEDYAKSIGKEVNDSFIKDCQEGKYKNDFDKFITEQREKYGPKSQNTEVNKEATSEHQSQAAENKAKDMYEGLNLTDSQRKIIDSEFNQLKDIYNNPDKWNLSDDRNKEAALGAYKESLKMQGFSDFQISDILSRQKESVKDDTKYQDMFKSNIAKRNQARESVGIKDIEENTGVDKLADKAQLIQQKRGIGPQEQPHKKDDGKTKIYELNPNQQQKDNPNLYTTYGSERA